MAAEKRIQRELKDLRLHPVTGIHAWPTNEKNLYQWDAVIIGPKDTPYEGGNFRLKIDLPKGYPFQPPKVRFTTTIYHCNVYKSGNICLDILDTKWSPALKIETVLLSISALLAEANPSSPADGVAGNQYVSNRKQHDITAREYTQKYAK